ncbi:sugar ABC transporter permease [Streptomyces sp. NPDC051940]|uniref:carbohydrate ABC transporter permease n=1 Tax=Streptomyces sp. NPDC051940 TaxID=3155675 RepID=UPI00343BE21F
MAHPALRAKRRMAALRTLGFLSPWLIGFSVFFVYPLISTVYFSFTHYDGYSAPTWSGTQNWAYVFQDYPFFWPSLRNTLWLVVVMVSTRVAFGLGIGMLVTRLRRGGNLFRTFFYLPYLAPPVAATLAFVFLLNPGTGPVNTVLGGLGLPEPGWFKDADWSKPALTLLALWGIGDLMVIFLAALLDVPKQQYEAAELDGANSWHRFRYITLPNIKPIIVFAVVTGAIQIMSYYTQAVVAGKVSSGEAGGAGEVVEPGYPEKSTLTLPSSIYNLAFQRGDYGAACVIALVLFACSMAFTLLLMRRRFGLVQGGE